MKDVQISAPVGPFRVLIADADAVGRLGVSTILHAQPGLEVVAEAEDVPRTLALVERCLPDLLYVDWELASRDDAWMLRRLHSMAVPCRAITAAAAFSYADLGLALQFGVRGVLTRQEIVGSLVTCLERVAQGEYFVAPGEMTWPARARHAASPIAEVLSPREIEIVNRVVEGASNKQIASELGIGEQTVKNLLRRVFQKLGVENRVTLTLRTLGMKAG